MTDNPIISLAPTEFFMQIPWIDGLRYAIGDADIMAHFRAETGITWEPGRTPIDRMVDEATSTDLDFLLTFIRWFNRWFWGEVDGRACNGDEPESRLWNAMNHLTHQRIET